MCKGESRVEKAKKDKLVTVSLWALLAVVVLFVIITTSVIKTRRQYLEDLANKNQQIEDKLPDEDDSTQENLKIF